MSCAMEINALPGSEPEIVIRIQGPYQYVVVSRGITHSRAIQELLGCAADAGEEPALRFADGTPAIHISREKVGGLFSEREAMVVIMPTKRIAND